MTWQPPEFATSKLRHRFGDSVLLEFVRGHSYSAVLRELAQNEYDAQGRTLQVTFADTALEVEGDGKPIDRQGWRRLSVTLGTGSAPHIKGNLEEKANGIGSKNFGLRSLFLFGDRIYIRSNGYQTLLDLQHGTPTDPVADTSTAATQGVRIHVPYRTAANGALHPFTVDIEHKVLDDFARNMSLHLLKLAHHGTTKSLNRVIVLSERTNRRLVWKQNVKQPIPTKRGIKLLVRRITMTDSSIGKTQSTQEFEWQKRIELPERFREEHIPGYFRDRGSYIRIGVSLPTKGGKLDRTVTEGRGYYPLGVEHAYTGNKVSINAPFEMDADRSELVDPSNSTFNAWLLDLAANMTIDLLPSDWFYRFGADAYRAVGDIGRSALSNYSESLKAYLESYPCWPTRKSSRGKKGSIPFASVQKLVTVADSSLDYFLDDQNYLHSDLNESSDLRQLSCEYGAKEFTIGSLVRLRCAGEDASALQSTLKQREACWYYTAFPDAWMDLSKQRRCADALDKYRRHLSNENPRDLTVSPTTITANGALGAPEHLWAVPNEILDTCQVIPENRIHPELLQARVTSVPTLELGVLITD